MILRLRFGLVFAVLAVVSCAADKSKDESHGSSGAEGGSGTGGNSATSGFSLTVTRATKWGKIGGSQAGAGNKFVKLEVTLANETVPAALSLNMLFFSLETTAAIVFQASPASAFVNPACRADAAVAAGGTLACELVFEIPDPAVTQTLTYDDHMGHAATAAVPDEMSVQSCEVYETYVAHAACTTCIDDICGMAKQEAVNTVAAECPRTCHDECNNTKSECQCIDECLTNQLCADAIKAYIDCVVRSCDAYCQP